jgi:hypothetical protein
MTYGFALLTMGTLLVYSGWSNNSIADVLRGLGKTPKSGAGDTGFIALLTAPVAGATSAATPGSGGEGSATSKGTPKGLTTFDGKPVCKWVAEELEWARNHGWGGSLTSGYRDYGDQVRACEETSGPCAEPGKSNHQGKKFPKCAADVSNPQELEEVLSKKPGRRLHYTGKGIGDEPHFSSGLAGV